MRCTNNKEVPESPRNSSRAVGRGIYFLKRMSSVNAPSTCSVLGIPFSILPGVFSPALSKATEFFAKELVKDIQGKSVFEVGCGSGVISILCALNGASQVFCSDISDVAIKNTTLNAKMHGVEDKVHIIKSSDFDSVVGRFDIVFFALPYVYIEDAAPIAKRFGYLTYSIFDENYAAQKIFLKKAARYVAPNGKILVGFSKIGEIDRFLSNVNEVSCSTNLIKSEREGRTDNRLYEVTPLKKKNSAEAV